MKKERFQLSLPYFKNLFQIKFFQILMEFKFKMNIFTFYQNFNKRIKNSYIL